VCASFWGRYGAVDEDFTFWRMTLCHEWAVPNITKERSFSTFLDHLNFEQRQQLSSRSSISSAAEAASAQQQLTTTTNTAAAGGLIFPVLLLKQR